MSYKSNAVAIALLIAICGIHSAKAAQTSVVTRGSATYAFIESWNDTDTEVFQMGGGRLTVDNYAYKSKDIVFTGRCPDGSRGSALKLTGSNKRRVIIPECN